MTRAIDPATDAAASAAEVRLAVLVEMEFASGTSRIWSGLGQFTWGARTFQGVGDLLAVSEIEETAEVRSVGARLTLSGLPTSTIGLLSDTERWANRTARIWLALFQADGVTLAGEPVQALRGRMDQLAYEEGASATYSLSIESRLVDLRRARIRRYTSADQQQDYPTDLGFAYVESVAAGVDVEGW